jgi:hypothetical protein
MVGAATSAVELPTVDPSLNTPPTNVLFWGPSADFPYKWTHLQPPTESRQTYSRAGFGPEVSAARALAARHPGTQIAIIKFAVSGTNLYRQWDPDNPFSLYAQLIARVRYATHELSTVMGRGTRIAGFFWMQGEADSRYSFSSHSYARHLTHFIAKARHDLHASRMPFVIGRVADGRLFWPSMHYSGVVRSQQAKVARDVFRAYLVSTDGLERAVSSRIHFSTKGTVGLGRRFVRRDIPL